MSQEVFYGLKTTHSTHHTHSYNTNTISIRHHPTSHDTWNCSVSGLPVKRCGLLLTKAHIFERNYDRASRFLHCPRFGLSLRRLQRKLSGTGSVLPCQAFNNVSEICRPSSTSSTRFTGHPANDHSHHSHQAPPHQKRRLNIETRRKETRNMQVNKGAVQGNLNSLRGGIYSSNK